MSDEIHKNHLSGKTLYAVRFNGGGQVALTDGSSFENWGANSHDADDYDVALSEIGSGGCQYVGDFDASSNIAAGRYTVVVFLQVGVNPEDGDVIIGEGQIIWTGSGELTADKVLANKAVQTKNTGVIEYYDDDGVTPLLSLTPTDAEASITRTPS